MHGSAPNLSDCESASRSRLRRLNDVPFPGGGKFLLLLHRNDSRSVRRGGRCTRGQCDNRIRQAAGRLWTTQGDKEEWWRRHGNDVLAPSVGDRDNVPTGTSATLPEPRVEYIASWPSATRRNDGRTGGPRTSQETARQGDVVADCRNESSTNTVEDGRWHSCRKSSFGMRG
jgi:hypothetical protein